MSDLSVSDSIELLVPGGALRKPSMALIGHISRTFFEHINADLVFLGATSFSLEKGMSCTNLIEAQTKQNMIRCGLSVCLLVDYSKADKISMAHICDWDDIDILVADSIKPEYKESLKQRGIKIMTPSLED
jgi:DeoR/GlpR family transcriptional regulator of sugar metabolism